MNQSGVVKWHSGFERCSVVLMMACYKELQSHSNNVWLIVMRSVDKEKQLIILDAMIYLYNWVLSLKLTVNAREN